MTKRKLQYYVTEKAEGKEHQTLVLDTADALERIIDRSCDMIYSTFKDGIERTISLTVRAVQSSEEEKSE